MKTLLIAFLLLASMQNLFAQQSYEGLDPVLFLGYSQQQFLNSSYNKLKQQGYISSGQGGSAGMRYRFAKYLSIDIGGFYGVFSVKEDTPSWIYKDVAITTAGMDLSFNLLLMSRQVKWLKPYASAGYQSSHVRVSDQSTNSNNSSQPATTFSRMDTSGAFWSFKTFLLIYRLELGAEYRQTFGKASTRHLQVSINIPLKLFRPR